MRLLTYNIHGCIGRDRREKPERILDIIRQSVADVVGLQEVHSDDQLDRDFLVQLETLPYAAVIYGKTMRKPSADYGNIMLLREPPENTTLIDLPSKHGEPRGAIIADTVQHGEPVRIIVTHLDTRMGERRRQMHALQQYMLVDQPDAKCILMGDLNEWLPARRYFKDFKAQFSALSELKTFPTWPRLFALDRIALKGKFAVSSFKRDDSKLARTASDHLPLSGYVR